MSSAMRRAACGTWAFVATLLVAGFAMLTWLQLGTASQRSVRDVLFSLLTVSGGAIGSDTAMSIRHPAALCGIVGLKPTYGRVSKYGAMPLSFSLDHLGPMTRTVRDAALMLQIMAGHDPLDATTENRPVPDYVAAVAQAPTRLDGLRIGVPREPFFEDLAPGWDVIIESALMVFKAAGATVEELLLPHSADLNHVGSIIILAEGAAFHNEAYGRDSSKLGPGLRALVESGRQLSAVDFVQAPRIRRMLCQEALTAMAPYDALLLPTTPLPACLVSEDDPALVSQRYRNCLLFDVLSVPAISVPCGFDGDDMPVGLQIVGKSFAEERLLALARFYERETQWHLRLPPVHF